MTQYTLNKQPKPDEAGINISEIFDRARQFWYLFLLCPLLMLGLAWFYLKNQLPTYEVKSMILIKDEKNKQGVSAADLISKDLQPDGTKKILVDESTIMTSHTVIEQVVKDLKLDRSVLRKGGFKNQEIYGAASPIKIDSFKLTDTLNGFEGGLHILDGKSFELTTPEGNKQIELFGSPFSNKYGYFIISKSNNPDVVKDTELAIVCKGVEKAATEIIKTIDIVLPKKESNMIEPTMLTKIPEKAKDILQKMVDVYNSTNLVDKSEVSQNTLAFIEKRLVALTNELSGVEQNVETYKVREGMTAESQTDIAYFFNKLGEYDSEVVKLEVQNSLLTSIEDILTKTDPNFDLLPTNLELKSTNLQSQIDNYNKLVLERNRLARVAGDNNPTLKNLSYEINSVKRAIIGNISRVKQENTALLTQNKAKNNQFSNKLNKTPRNERELTDIKRQQNIKEGLYLFLLQKQEETTISIAGAIPDARVIDRPIISETPTGIKKPILYLMSCVLGLFLSLVFVILRGLAIDTIQSEKDITNNTQVPILAKIPFSKSTDNWGLQGGNNTFMSEMFRSLRSNLQFVDNLVDSSQLTVDSRKSLSDNQLSTVNRQPNKAQMLLITSSTSGEGKDFIALNLGVSLAIANKKTVIINLDLRKPTLTSPFPFLNKKIGITRYVVVSDMYPNEVIQPSGIHKDLFYIHNGDIPHNPSEMMMNYKIDALLNYLKDNYDYVLINTPPIGLVADALALKAYIDITLFIVRAGVTKKWGLSTINEYADGRKLPNPVIIFNGVNSKGQKANSKYYRTNSRTQIAERK